MSAERFFCVLCACLVRCAQTYHRGCGQHWREDKVRPGSDDLDVKLVRVNHLDLPSFSAMSVRFGMLNDDDGHKVGHLTQESNLQFPMQHRTGTVTHQGMSTPTRAEHHNLFLRRPFTLLPANFQPLECLDGPRQGGKKGESCHHAHKRGRGQRDGKSISDRSSS